MPSIYEDIVTEGVEHDSHASDLYVPDTPQVREILAKHSLVPGWSAQRFTSNIDNKPWLDLPWLGHSLDPLN